jgi:hypothetical protein
MPRRRSARLSSITERPLSYPPDFGFGSTAGVEANRPSGGSMAAGSTGRRNTVHPYRQGSEAYGLPATWLSDVPRSYKHE